MVWRTSGKAAGGDAQQCPPVIGASSESWLFCLPCRQIWILRGHTWGIHGGCRAWRKMLEKDVSRVLAQPGEYLIGQARWFPVAGLSDGQDTLRMLPARRREGTYVEISERLILGSRHGSGDLVGCPMRWSRVLGLVLADSMDAKLCLCAQEP